MLIKLTYPNFYVIFFNYAIRKGKLFSYLKLKTYSYTNAYLFSLQRRQDKYV